MVSLCTLRLQPPPARQEVSTHPPITGSTPLTPPFFHTDYGEQRHLQEANTVRLPRTARPRASLHRLRDAAAQPLDLPGLTRPCGSQAPQQPQDEEALLSMLLQKQAELQKMRAAIDELKTMDAGVTVRRAAACARPARHPNARLPPCRTPHARSNPNPHPNQDAASRLRPEAPSFAPPRSRPAPAPSSTLRVEAPAFAPPATRGGSAEPSEADLLAALKSKRDELLRMQQAIKQLEGMGPTGQEEEVDEDIDYGEEDFEQDDDEEEGEEPGSQEEWLQKLMHQQRELLQLRSAIESAKRGSIQEEEEYDDEEEEDDEEYDDDEGQLEEQDEDGAGVQGVLANLLAKKQELAELLTLKASLEKQLLQQEGDSDDDDGADEPVARIPLASARPSTRPNSAPPSDHPRARVPEAEFDTSMAEPEREGSTELRQVLEHRRRAQLAVTEQERKIAELSALQERLRSRLADLEDNNQEGDDEEDEEEEEEEDEDDEEEEEEPSEGITGEQLLSILAMKTRECQQLAAAVEQARESGMDERDPRLAQAEATLAYRYDEVKELAAIAARHGLSASGNGYEEEEDDEDEDDETDEEDEARMRARERELQYSGQGQGRAGRQEAWGAPREDLADLGAYEDDGYYEQQQALRKRWGAAQAAPPNPPQNAAAANPNAAMQAMEDVQRLEEELQACTEELRAVDSQTSRQVARHPAFQSMRQSVVDRLLSLQAQLDEAKGHYEDEMDAYEAQRARQQPDRRVAQREQEAAAPEGSRGGREQSAVHEAEMVPLLRDALDKLWDRPYEARVFTLQLLQGLADLEDRSLCMMCSCFARYLEKHSEPVE